MHRTRRFRSVPFLFLLASLGGCSFMKSDPAGTYPVFVKTVPAAHLAAVERPGKSYFSIGGDLANLAKSPLWRIRTGPLEATYYVNTRKDRKTPPSSDAALPIPAGAAVPAPFVAKDVPAQTVAYAFWRGDVFRGFKVIPSIEAWAEKNGWTVSSAITEVYVTSIGKDAAATGEAIVEVRLPVSRK